MGLFDEEEREEEAPEQQKRTDWTGVIIGATLLPVLFYFRHIGKTDLGLNVFVWLGVNLVVIRFHWNLRERLWFWGLMLALLAVELPLVLNVQWPRGWVPGIALVPIGIAGFLIANGAIQLVERYVMKSPPDESD